MAVFFGLLNSKGFLWLQLAIFVWQAIRPAAVMRVPWALFSTAVYRIFGGKKFHREYFLLLSTDYNDTADANQFCEDNCERINEFTLDGSSAMHFQYKNSHYICDNQKASQVRLLIAAELNNVPIVKEYKVITAFMGVWTLCSADEAIRMCLPSKRFRLSFRRTVWLCLIEHMPLILDTYWLSKVLSGIPLYLNAKGKEELSSILTFALIILDFTYNIWVPLLEKSYLMFVRCLQLILSTLPPNLRFLFFYLLSNFDDKYMPCSISDLKVKIRETNVFYATDNAVLNCPVDQISKIRFDEVDISQDNFEVGARVLRVVIRIFYRRNNFVHFELRLQDVLFNLVKARYTMSLHNFQTYVGCWKLPKEDNIGLDQTVDEGFINSMHLSGFEETIDLFWGSDVSVYKFDAGESHHFLIA